MKKTDEIDDWYPEIADLENMRHISEVDPELLSAFQNGKIKSVGRKANPQKKVALSIRVEPSILNAYKAKGKGWQILMNNALKKWIEEEGRK